jgi:heme oxygenase
VASEIRCTAVLTPPPGHARFHLRDATAARHDAVDDAFSAFDLKEPAGYRSFLEAQYACIAPLEAALTAGGLGAVLPDWPARHRGPLLAADVAELGGAASPVTDMDVSIFSGAGALLGAAYVLEGSRFGGAVLARRLPPGAPQRFLGAAAQPKAWRALVASLDHHLAPQAEMDAAVAAADAVFAAFEAAARSKAPARG